MSCATHQQTLIAGYSYSLEQLTINGVKSLQCQLLPFFPPMKTANRNFTSYSHEPCAPFTGRLVPTKAHQNSPLQFEKSHPLLLHNKRGITLYGQSVGWMHTGSRCCVYSFKQKTVHAKTKKKPIKKATALKKIKSIKGFGGAHFLINHGTDRNVEGGTRATDLRQAASPCSQKIFTSSMVS